MAEIEITTQEKAANVSEEYKADIIKYLGNKVKFAATAKKHVYETLSTIMPNRFSVKQISDELDEVTIYSGIETTVLKFHWKLLSTSEYLKKYYLYDID